MKREPDEKKAYQLALRCLAYRSRTCEEMKRYLKTKGFSDLITRNTIEKLKRQAYLDDRQFCVDWIYYRQQKGIGSVRLAYELKQKGVPQNIIKENIQSLINIESEYQKAASLLEQFVQKKGGQPAIKLYRQAGSFLTRRGFPQSIIRSLIESKFNSIR
ncbi:MAG: regulatory protein RecX [Dethiobacteria bacterium]|jgi:regulatory protein